MSGSSEPANLLGLVRGVDYDLWRHVHGFGAEPEGAVAVGELGALLLEPEVGTAPLWLTEDGRVVADGHEATSSRPSLRSRLWWVRSPLTLRETMPRRALYRSSLARLRRLPSRPWRRRRMPGKRGEAPVGYLHRSGGVGRRELFSSVHPVTGDQLLSTSRAAAAEFGFERSESLGYLLTAAPVTGTLALARPVIPWAQSLGFSAPGSPRGLLSGRLVRPGSKQRTTLRRDNVRVTGWALLTDEPVARVEVLVNGGFAGRARLGLQRPRKFKVNGALEAPICGFDLRVLPSMVPETNNRIAIEAVVTGVRGSEIVLAAEDKVRLRPPILPPSLNGSSRQDRKRLVRAPSVGKRPPRTDDGAPVRVAAFAHNLEPGGAQRTLFEQLTRLAQRGDFESLVVSPRDGPWRERFERQGIPVHLVADYPVDDDERYLERRAELAAWMVSERIDAVFANTLGCFIGVDVAHTLGLPSVWMIHESYELPVWWNMTQRDRPDAVLRTRAMQALVDVDAVLFPADATRRLFSPYLPSATTAVAACGVEFDQIDRFREQTSREQVRSELGLGSESRLILCLGVIEPRKGQAVLARAWSLIADQHPEAKLALVGARDSPYAAGLRRFIEQSGIEDRFVLSAATMEPLKWHLAADLFVLPSDVESAPVVLAEAMAFETPVIAANVFGIPEMITDEADGYLCDPNDVSSLAETIDRMLRLDDAERASIARAGRARAMEHHDPVRFQRGFEALLERLTGRGPESG